jgi:two-component system, OmpR family, alkaline phosphatase synthesis response regulator PhoP
MSQETVVLLIEDSLTQAREITLFLKRAGIQVVHEEDGGSGLKRVYSLKPDAIVLDVNLPTMDGLQICRRVKRDPEVSHIPIIMLTSADNADATLNGIEAGADDYIPKDRFAIDNLLTTLAAIQASKGES